MSDCRFSVSLVNYPDPDLDPDLFSDILHVRTFLKKSARYNLCYCRIEHLVKHIITHKSNIRFL